jgi:hypothetical protein
VGYGQKTINELTKANTVSNILSKIQQNKAKSAAKSQGRKNAKSLQNFVEVVEPEPSLIEITNQSKIPSTSYNKSTSSLAEQI